MKAITLAAQSIMLGHRDVMMAGGMESMSNVPFYLEKGRGGLGLGHGTVTDGIIKDGLWDVYYNQHMGTCAEETAAKYNLTREQQDAFAVESYRRAAAAFKVTTKRMRDCNIHFHGSRSGSLIKNKIKIPTTK